jgi:hypothetical protein
MRHQRPSPNEEVLKSVDLAQLAYAGFGDSSPDTEARFLNSFTVHDATK